ncbi:DNA repair protein RecN [Vallitalea okinawensis]|uniref:DNA repair protein RecN n=1 Tax=Vallitalea okinawensis TaxID=2078660 RepID=UPI000CFD69CA|nr:DNA repair protein RecN [Vallitalea okinawensis]
MLQHLYVKDIALIDEVAIDFNDQLNILTGETGAGKSILIGSINIALGQRGAKDLVRKGTEKGSVELLFQVEPPIVEKIRSQGFSCGDDGQIVISRVISSAGRSHSKINGETVTNQSVKQLASLLIDIHGQHEHQSLLDEQKHIDLLDMFCKDELKPGLDKLSVLLNDYHALETQMRKLGVSDQEKERRISILEYEIKEINEANLIQGEDDRLLQQRKRLMNSKRLYDGCNEIHTRLKGDFDTNMDVLTNVNDCIQVLKEMVTYDDNLKETLNNLENASIWLEEVSSDVRDYINTIDHDEDSLMEVESRLDVIQKMKRKYGHSIEEVLAYHDEASKELKQLLDIEEELERLRKELSHYKNKILKVCESLNAVRVKTARNVQERIENILKTLQFDYAKFVIQVNKRNGFTYTGYDDVRFLISTNIGEDVKPLTDIASGGEMSRIMLALKTVLAEIDEIPTLIFDEIDTGISGRTAQKVAEKLNMIAEYHQVLCITHLPQIAAMADEHLLIEKTSNSSKTTTQVRRLNDLESQEELARLLSGASITETTLENAREIINLANRIKSNN